jgi:hypothetical protein
MNKITDNRKELKFLLIVAEAFFKSLSIHFNLFL